MVDRWHTPPDGWRRVAWDIGIVVVGVVIALVAQQVADELRWGDAVRQERVSLDEGVREAWNAASARRVVQPCITRRLADIGRVLDRHSAGRPLGIFGPIGRATVWSSDQSALAMASADGTLAHFPIKVRSDYFRVKSQTEEFQRASWDERAAWRTLNKLNRADSLNENGWQDIYTAYQDALDADRIARTNLVPTYQDGWVSSFNSFPAMPENKSELDNPLTRTFCRSAVTS